MESPLLLMSGETPAKSRLSKRQFRILMMALLVVSLIVIALFGAPLASPFGIQNVSVSSNTFVPITANGGFESKDSTWVIESTGAGQAEFLTGGAASGNRSLYISDPGQSTEVIYNNSVAQILPVLVNSSISFGFDLKYVGPAVDEGQSFVTLILILKMLPNTTIPLSLVLANSTAYIDTTYDSVNASSGILMLRSVRSVGSWTSYQLQLGTPRLISLITAFLSTTLTPYQSGASIYVTGMAIEVGNANAYFDNVALYNIIPSVAKLTLSKSTLLPSYLLGFLVLLNGSTQNCTQSYGPTQDTLMVTMDIPLAYNATYTFQIQTGWGYTAPYSVMENSSSLPSWI
jgi:hypothetical protein